LVYVLACIKTYTIAMFKNYFKIAWRNIVRHKAYSIINISGLKCGYRSVPADICCAAVRVELQHFNKNFKNIYHIVTQQNENDGVTYNPGVSIPAIDALRIDFPQYKFAALNSSYGSQITVIPGA
jgi:putative ABC transport system permease protein